MGEMSPVDAAEPTSPAGGVPSGPPGAVQGRVKGAAFEPGAPHPAQGNHGWRVWLPGAVLGVLLVLWGATGDSAVVGNLDDVYVVLHEARGWLAEWGVSGHGSGVRFSRPMVEGSTSALDVVVKGAGLALAPGADPLVLAGWMGLAWLCGAVIAFAVAAARVGGSRVLAWLCVAGFATSLGLIESASYRLEGPLFAMLWVTLLGLAMHGRPRSAWFLAVLVCLARPEGLVLAPLAWWLSTVGSTLAMPLRLGSALAIPGLVSAVRWWTFGSWAPNAYFAKRSDSALSEWLDGVSYLDEAIRTPSGLGWLLLVCAGLWCLWSQRSTMGATLAPRVLTGGWLMGLSLVAAGIVVGSGGDSYSGTRLALPLAAPAWLALVCFGLNGRGMALATAAAAFLLQISSARPGEGTGPVSVVRTVWDRLRTGPSGAETFAGDAAVFRRVTAALGEETFAHRHVQRFRWFEPDASVFDLTGITERDVARMSWGGQVLFGRDAIDEALARRTGAIYLDVLSSRPLPWAEESPSPVGDADIRLVRRLSDPVESQTFLGPPPLPEALARKVASEYAAASTPHPGTGGYFNLLVRKDLAASFRSKGFTVYAGR